MIIPPRAHVLRALLSAAVLLVVGFAALACESTDKVIGKAPKQEDCVKDVDVVVFEQVFGVAETGALCLDVDWVEGQCYKLADTTDPVKLACAAGDPAIVKVGATVQGAADDSACPNGGAVYPTRKLAVCFEPAV